MDETQSAQMHMKIARNVSLLSMSVGLTMVIGLAMKMLLPRIMGPEKMGIFYFADSFANVFFAFLPLGLTTYINRTVPGNHQHTRDIFGTILVVECIAALAIGLLLTAAVMGMGKDTETVICTVFMGVYAAIFSFQRYILQKIFIAVDKVKLVSIINVVVKCILVLGCLLVFKFNPSVILIAVMHGISELIGLAYLLFESHRQKFTQSKPSMDRLKEILKISLPFYLASVLTTAFTEVDTNMLAFMSTNTEVGYFGAANKLVGVFMLMVPILQSSFTPALSQAWNTGRESYEVLVKQLFNFLLVCSLPLSVVLVLFGDYLSRTLYGEGFEASYKILCFLTPVLTMLYINTFTAMTLHLTSTGGKISRIFLIGVLINVALDYLVIPYGEKMGPGGAGVAVSFCTFACECYSFFAMLRIFPGKILDFKLAKNLFVIFAPCWTGMYFYDSMITLSLGERLIVVAFVPIYALLTRLVTPMEIRAFVELIRKTLLKKQ